jgi:hypothetical protein
MQMIATICHRLFINRNTGAERNALKCTCQLGRRAESFSGENREYCSGGVLFVLLEFAMWEIGD